MRRSPLVLLLLSLLLSAVPAMAETTEVTLFRDLDFDQALERAALEEKMVLVDYFTTWCVPCKKMDATTWIDPRVVAWVDENAVAVHFDAEIETDLAKQHKIATFPTTLLLRADGTEIDRLTGYKSTDELLTEIADALAGRTAVDRAREAWEESGGDASLRMRYGAELANAGRHDEALEHYMALWDAPAEENPGFVGVRVSFLLGRIERLARQYPPAKEALEARRKTAELAILRGDGEDGSAAARQLFLDYDSLSSRLDPDPERALDLYDRILARGDELLETRKELAHQFEGALLEARRYDDVLRDRDPFAAYTKAIEDSERNLDQLGASITGDARDHAVQTIRSMVSRSGLRGIEALLGTGQSERAWILVEQVLKFDESEETWILLLKAARRAGDADALTRLEARAPAAVLRPTGPGAEASAEE